jgi:hypothetical protein
MIGLANPAGLAALLAVGVLLALHLLRRRRRVIPVASLVLWRRVAAQPLEPQRLRVDLLLLLQLGLVLTLIGGLVRPHLRHGTAAPTVRSLLLVLDTSASMQAREADGVRFETARRRASALAAAADEVMLVEAGARPRVTLRWTAERARVRERLETCEALDTPGDLGAAVDLAVSEARARPGVRVTVLTDLPRAAIGAPADELDAVDWVQIGRTDDNVAVASVVVEQAPFHAARDATATVVVRNYAARPKRAVLDARVGERSWARRELVLAPRATEHVLLADPPAAGVVTVLLAVDDALPLDDEGYAWIGADEALDVLLVSDAVRTSAAVAELLARVPGSRIAAIALREYEVSQPVGHRAVVFDGVVPYAMPTVTNALYVEPPPGNTLCPSARDTVAGAAVVDWESTHPALADVGELAALRVGRARRLETPAWGTALVTAAADGRGFPLLIAGERGGRRIACLGARLPDASSDDLPLLVLLLGALRWLEESPASVLVVRTGVPTIVGGDAARAIATDGLRVAGDPAVLLAERAGLHLLGERPVVANLFDERESDVGRDGGGEWPARTGHAGRAATTAGPEFGWWLYLAAAGLLGLEWLVWLRRRHA